MSIQTEVKFIYKRSPRSCLLQWTLLFLLCIYIKRLDAAPASPSPSFKRTALGASNDERLNFDLKMVHQKESFYSLNCPLNNLIKRKPKASSQHWKAIYNEILNKTHVIWLKNNKTIHRENGNPILIQQYDQDQKALVLFNVGPSDAGTYTCLLNYTNVPQIAYNYYILYPSATFKLEVESENTYLPDIIPTIIAPPQNIVGNRGANVTFTCRKLATLLHSTIYWFKSCSFKDSNGIEAFSKDYNRTVADRQIQRMKKYVIQDQDREELTITNISNADAGYYGCLLSNDRGIDIRLGKLETLDLLIESMTPLSKNQPEITTSLTNNEIFPTTNSNIIKSETPSVKGNKDNVRKISDPDAAATVEPTKEGPLTLSVYLWGSITIVFSITSFTYYLIRCPNSRREKKFDHNSLMPAPIVGCGIKEVNLRQHLPEGDCPDIYGIGKSVDGFISGQLLQPNGHVMTQSISSQRLEKEKNPSITSNSNSDEASSWGKSMSSQGDNSRAFYLHTSETTTTTVPLYDHPPSTGTAQLCESIVQDACVINPTYGFLRPETNATDWNFPRRNLERLNKIGEGQFGEVFRYIARYRDGVENVVAVKQLRNRVGLGDRERLELIAEIEIMKSINCHPNVIKLLHYCVDDTEPILLIMEYAENGKLQTYLRNCRYSKTPYGFIGKPNPEISSKDLVKFSYHIAKGMEFVASKGIIHRDLASRNILVSRDKVCKVADFGFARRVTDDCAYERTTANPVPVKWMAPESLVENKFTTKSDVFSLGILMWEIVTLGATPYECLTSSEVYKKVTTGGRLEKPAHCKDEFHKIMSQCWLQNPAERPSFREIARQLEELLLSENDYIQLDQYPERAYYNIINTEEKEIVHNIIL